MIVCGDMRYEVYAVVDFFFFQAEDGIRDIGVTGVQTCALPICSPSVSVPVLSRTTASTRETFSRVAASLIRMLCLAPMPVPTATAVGVARPRASGQAITTAENADVIGVMAAAPPKKNQARKVTTPEPTARITRYSAPRSASRWPGALEFCACCTRSTIWASVVSAPTAVALKRTLPLRLIEPAITASPGRFMTGTLSPVTSASSMLVLPSVTSPSTGTLSPGLRSTVSLRRTSLLGIVTRSEEHTSELQSRQYL